MCIRDSYSPISAPINYNEELGTLKIYIPSFIEGQEERVVEYPIYSSSEINKGGFSKKFIAALKVSFSKIYQFVKFEKYLN